MKGAGYCCTAGDNIIDPITDDTITHLWLLARGDFDLVEEAVIASMEQVSTGWVWRQKEWRVNIEKAINHILERRKEIESINPPDTID